MADSFPIPAPARLPVKIDPCPIAEAILELRFITGESWRTLPGLFYTKTRDRYPKQIDLPLAQMPEDMRLSEPMFTFQPLVRFLSEEFLIQLGPRVISLVTKANHYPGWPAIESEAQWLLEQLRATGIVSEGERLAVRYVNFFDFDIYPKLELQLLASGKGLEGVELSIAAVLRQKPLTARLRVANGAILNTEQGPRHGSVLDAEVWLGSLDFDLFNNGLQKLREAHLLEKQIFFGLLKSEFLTTLNPVYE